jgi:hypothetical protein
MICTKIHAPFSERASDWVKHSNCLESTSNDSTTYISIGKIDDDALVRWVEWEELYPSPVTVFQSSFLRAYTLAKYRDWMEEQQLELENVCQRIVKFGKVLAGPRDDLLAPLIEHILRPGIRFWGLDSQLSEDAVKSEIHELLLSPVLEINLFTPYRIVIGSVCIFIFQELSELKFSQYS